MMHDLDRHTLHAKLPAGFVRRRKATPSPYPERSRVELMIRTADGLLGTGATQPRLHPDGWSLAPSAIGGIVGYRRLGA